jgi:hypothetical protein
MDRFQSLSTANSDALHLDHDALQWSRARYCELLAIGCLESLLQEHGKSHVITHVLAAVYPNHNILATEDGDGIGSAVRDRFRSVGEDTEPESAIEQGLECNARSFVEHKIVSKA